MTVEIDRLKATFLILLDHLRESRGEVIDFDVDYFWSVPPESLYDPDTTPGGLTMGQLSESWENLESIRTNPDGAINYGLVWLADVLRALGHQEPG
jgi:hypothetical protein